jgi:hypothetical protein
MGTKSAAARAIIAGNLSDFMFSSWIDLWSFRPAVSYVCDMTEVHLLLINMVKVDNWSQTTARRITNIIFFPPTDVFAKTHRDFTLYRHRRT